MALFPRTCILDLKTEQDGIFRLKAPNPMVLQQCAQRVQGVIERFETQSTESRRKKLYLNTAKVNEEVPPAMLIQQAPRTRPCCPRPWGNAILTFRPRVSDRSDCCDVNED